MSATFASLAQAFRAWVVVAATVLLVQCSSPVDPSDPPPPVNTPPVVRSITASVPKIEIDQSVTFTAVVEDLESPIGLLTLVWSSTAGAFTGSGLTVSWKPEATLSTPANPVVTLTVTESYAARNAQGQTVTQEHRVAGTSSVRVHNSPVEVGTMARQFLEDFSRQVRPPETVVRDFRDGCGNLGAGKAAELADVRRNQEQRQINQWTVGTPQVSINYGGVCPFRNRRADACAQVSVDWWDTQIVQIEQWEPGTRWHSYGIDQVTAEYHEDRWWLCDSDFDGDSDEVFSPSLTAVFARLPGSFFKK